MNISGLCAIDCWESNLDQNGNYVSLIRGYRVEPNFFFTTGLNAFNELKKVLKSKHGKKGVDYKVTYESDRRIKIKTNNIQYEYVITPVTIRIK